MQVIHKNLFGRQTFSSYIARRRNSRFVGISVAVLFSLLSFTILFPVQIKSDLSYAADYGGPAGNPSTTSLNLTLTDDTLALDLITGSTTGSFAASSPANFTVSTNNSSGYTLSIKSKVTDPSNSTQVANASRLVNTDDSSEYISSIASSLAPATFSNSSNTQYNNQWGYLPSKLNSNNNTNYLPAPSYDTATILNTTACANGTSPCTSNTDSYSITLGARVNNALSSGTYEHVFTIIALGNPVNYSITYNANDGANGANTTNMPSPNPQTGDASGTTITLSNNKPQRTGYDFKGWCTVQPTADSNYPNDQNCAGSGATIYQPGAALGIDQTTVNIVTLYATWWQPNLTKLNNHTMQEMSPMACYNSSINDTATLTDNRDGTTRSYTVAKLADGLCWMTTNLNLGADHNITLTPNNTDITTDFTLPKSSSNYSSSTSSDNINAPYNLNNHTIASHTVNGVTYTTSVASYYTYAAATADTYTYSKSSSSYVTTSICPKNWDLPTESQYLFLRTKGLITSASAAFASPNTFTYGGYRIGTNSFSNQTTRGYYWTSKNSSSNNAYWTYVYSNGLYSSTMTSYKYYGAMIRCVASNGTVTINYNGNGTTEYPVTGTVAAQENIEINSTMVRGNTFTRGDWGFASWNTKPDGTGVSVAAGNPLSNLNLAPGSTITLYAQWAPRQRFIYNNNCSIYTTGCSSATDTIGVSNWVFPGNSITLAENSIFIDTKPGYAVTSWNTARDGSGTSYSVSTATSNSYYQVPSDISVPNKITLYAQWSPAFTINFNSNGGSGTMQPQLIPENSSSALRNNSFSKSGYQFAGWMTETSKDTSTVVYRNQATYTVGTITPGDSVTLYAKWVSTYTLQYSKNNDSAVIGEMVAANGSALTHTNTYEGKLVDSIYAPNYKKSGYGFAGWSPSPTATVGGDDPIYGPNESIYAPDYEKYGTNNTVTLYPVWIAKDTTDTMQTFNSSNRCSTMPQATYNSTTGTMTVPAGSIIALEDERDHDVYAVAKLADGNCWMIENLRLDDSVDATTMASKSQGIGGAFTALPQSVDNTWDSNTSNNLYTGLNAYTLPQLNTNNTNLGGKNASNVDLVSTPGYPINSSTAGQQGTTFSWYNYGNYYSWAAAMASTIQYSGYNGTGTSGSDSAGISICPTGWRLPKGTTQSVSGSFYYFNQQMGNNTSTQGSREWRMFPNNFVYSGEWYGSYASNRGNFGYYWSSSARDIYNAFSLSFNSLAVYPNSSSGKGCGFSVRCVAGV